MSKRTITIPRVLEFFREGDADTVRAVLPLVEEAVAARKLGQPKRERKSRKPRSAAAPTAPSTES